MELEASMAGSTAGGRFWSPYREALLPYMNLHAAEAVPYFLERLHECRYFRMLHALVRCKDAEKVRLELANSVPSLLAHTFDVPPPQPTAI
eukprot:3695465-Prymnesium_polylepis.1